MSREYAAFISYRHLPLDASVAENLHKLLERYRVPKELRQNGQKNLGIVFRDLDELPLSSNLTEDIFEALDHSKFLIVICTPETPKSMWVQREISYFIEKHGRDRVLTVLADGTMDDSIPKQITTEYAEDGKAILRQIEPLCAFLTDPDPRKVQRKLKKEFLRLAAAILDRPYDSLVQRQKRYRAQQITAAVGVVAVIALIFIGMLLERNWEISEKNEEISRKNVEISQHLLESQINETNALSLLSAQQLENLDWFGALQSALNALPHDGDNRPYSPAAEYALASALHPYGNGKVDLQVTIEQTTDVYDLSVSSDGSYLATLDPNGCIRCFDLNTTKLLWSYQIEDEDGYLSSTNALLLEILDNRQTLIYADHTTVYVFSLSTGELIHEIPTNGDILNEPAIALSPDESLIVVSAEIYDNERKCYVEYFQVYDTDTFDYVCWFAFDAEDNWSPDEPVFSDDNSRLLVPFYEYKQNMIRLYVFNLETYEFEAEHYIDPNLDDNMFATRMETTWLPDGGYMLYFMELPEESDNCHISIYKYSKDDEEICRNTEDFPMVYTSTQVTDSAITDTHVFFIHNYQIVSVELETCAVEYNVQLGLNCVLGSYLRFDDELVFVTQDGSIQRLSKRSDSPLTDQYIQCDFDLSAADGINQTDELICVVPEDTPNTVIVMQSTDNPNAVDVATPLVCDSNPPLSGLDIYSFPSGRYFLTMDTDYSNANGKTGYAFTIYDAVTLEETDRFTVETENLVSLVDFSADETKLLLDSYVYDLTTHALSPCEDFAAAYNGYSSSNSIVGADLVNRRFGESAITAQLNGIEDRIFWWEDGVNIRSVELPYEDLNIYNSLDYWELLEVGANGLILQRLYHESAVFRPFGYLILNTADESSVTFDNPCVSLGIPAIAMGGTEDWVVFADYDQVLRIYDYSSSAVIREFFLEVSAETIEKMSLITEDRYLLIFHGNERLTVIDTENGGILGEFQLDFYLSGTVIQTDPEFKTLYICVPNGTKSGLRIDMETWTAITPIPGLFCYLPETERILQVDQRREKMLVSPLYTVEELIEQGNSLLRSISE